MKVIEKLEKEGTISGGDHSSSPGGDLLSSPLGVSFDHPTPPHPGASLPSSPCSAMAPAGGGGGEGAPSA
jgi:hypothetical protein